ncbi:hypothetical protein [Haloimpatiens lingqiaonensis]|nr:hypothetical protein [Haloimpatiens lingqiaonensis]
MENMGMIVAIEIEAVLNKFGIPIQELKFTDSITGKVSKFILS